MANWHPCMAKYTVLQEGRIPVQMKEKAIHCSRQASELQYTSCSIIQADDVWLED